MNKVYRVFMYFALLVLPFAASAQNANSAKAPAHKKKHPKHHASQVKKENDSTAKKEQIERMLEEKTQNKPWNSKMPSKETKK